MQVATHQGQSGDFLLYLLLGPMRIYRVVWSANRLSVLRCLGDRRPQKRPSLGDFIAIRGRFAACLSLSAACRVLEDDFRR